MALSEAEELEMLEWENEEAALLDAPADAPRRAADSGEALLTNLPAQGFRQNLVRGLPAAGGGLAGAAAGAAMGAPFGPLGMAVGGVAGAFLGGSAGEAGRQAVSQGTAVAFPEQNYPVASGREVLRDVGIQGATQAGGQALGLGIGAAAGALRPAATKVGAQVIRVLSGVPSKTGEMVLRNPSTLLDAPGAEASAAAYTAFERYTGLKGLGSAVKAAGKFPGEGELEENLFQAAQKAALGTATPQELYIASQAASSLNRLGKMGNPRYAMLKATINESKRAVDDALEAVFPEYKSLRSGYAATKAASQFSTVLPLNVNQSPNVLRTVAATYTAAEGTLGGNPAKLLALPLISPRVYGAAIKGMALAGKIPAGVYQGGVQVAAGGSGSALSDAYEKRRRIAP